jgi:hypothetical protein
MMIDPKNVSAQLKYKARGNPPGAHPESAVGNFFPGLEFNFLSAWRRIFIGIELNESSTDVMGIDPNAPAEVRELLGFQLVGLDAIVEDGKVSGGIPILANVIGPSIDDPSNVTILNTIYLEWGNALAALHHEKGGTGQTVKCTFQHPDTQEIRELPLQVRKLFEPETALIARSAVQPGELTQSLCSPWQTDFVGCACYYWAANRPDYINVWDKRDGSEGGGHNWLNDSRDMKFDPEAGELKPTYTLASDKTLKHEDIMRSEAWEKKLRFVIEGKDES